MNCKETDNSIRLYSQNGAIDTANTNAVSFVNGGTSIVNLNGFPINPGQCISFGNEKDQCDKTKYQVAFINTGLQINALYVFRGHSGIQFSQIIAAIGGTHDNVNIFDSAGATLTASGGKLTVLDAAVVSAINGLVTSGLATAANQATEISILNDLPTSGLSTSALQTTLNSLVSTAANQTTINNNLLLIKLLSNLNVSISQKISSSYFVNPTVSSADTLIGLFSTGTIAAGYVVYLRGLQGGLTPVSGNIQYGVVTDGTLTHHIRTITGDGMFLTADSWNTLSCYVASGIYFSAIVYKISDLI